MQRREFVLKTVAGASSWHMASHSATTLPPASPASPAASETKPTRVDPAPFLTWDGGSGPSRDYWSQKLLLPWVHSGTGDWLDANQKSQGSLAYAIATVTLGVVTLPVTKLVNRWLNTGQNRGFYLKTSQAWPLEFAGRTHTTPAARPRLTIVTHSGTHILECTCNAAWSPSSYMGKDSRGSFSVSQDNEFAALQFDLSTLAGLAAPIKSAHLALTCLSQKYPGKLEVFELNPPEFRIGKGNLPERLGIANGFVQDSGIAKHPSVIFASDFSDLSKARWQSGGVATGSRTVADPKTRSTYLRGLIPKDGLLGCDLEHNLVGATPAGTPNKTETELYARYYVYLEEDWGSELDANKMPGWDGRFGWWNSAGYWQATTGNGGSPATGMKVRHASGNRWEYQGASMRGHGGPRSNDGNPYDDLFWVGNYIYHLDQTSQYGESIHWPGVVLNKGRWICIEQFIKMNSITGPFDEVGNGVALSDGQYTVWVDGAQAYERSNFRWRRHPEMGIQGFWLNWYHGGTAPAPRDMHFRMDAVVIARAYIGPRKHPYN